MSIKYIKKLAKTYQHLFLAVVRQVGSPKRMRNKIVSSMGAAPGQGLTEGNKHAKMKLEGPKKDLKSVQEREQDLIDSVDPPHYLLPANSGVGIQRCIPRTAT